MKTDMVVQEHVLDHAAELFEDGDLNRDGSLSCNEIVMLMRKVAIVSALGAQVLPNTL